MEKPVRDCGGCLELIGGSCRQGIKTWLLCPEDLSERPTVNQIPLTGLNSELLLR